MSQNFPLDDFLNWFMAHKRDLPWRNNPSFYEVLISEFMLQQTVVQTVIPYYKRWMSLFPTLEHLAKANYDEVLKAWEGLGYYSRARNLHSIAQLLSSSSSFQIDNYDSLKSLKGIGDYTACAILAFAFDKNVTAIDGNVLRVMARFLAIKEDIRTKTTKTQIQEFLNQIPFTGGRFAEALIELGALVCKPKPKCPACPLNLKCQAHHLNLIELIPNKTKRKVIQRSKKEILILIYENKVLVKKNLEKLMRDLHEFPQKDEFFEKDLRIISTISLPKIKRTFTSNEETLIPQIVFLEKIFESRGLIWSSIKELESLPFSAGHRKIRDLILKDFKK